MRRRLLGLGLAPAALAVIAAGCGGGSQSGTTNGPGSSATGPAPKAATPTVATAQTTLGNVLVDGQGRTVYLFQKDKGTASSCYSACASVWPPVTTAAKGVAGAHLKAGKLGSTKRMDGKTEVTYGGHPLYTYAGDAKAGDTKGQGLNQFGAEWYVLAPSGNKIDNG